jgi:hypothetical protein
MSNRRCGTCTLCCKLLPVQELHKDAGVRCQHQRHTGCAIYRTKPSACSLWSCVWLMGKAPDLARPDRSHYVIDPMPDYITIRNDESGESEKVVIVQIWIDPRFPDAHRDDVLRGYLSRLAMPALIRYNSTAAMVLFPPECTADDEWHEVTTNMVAVKQHDFADIHAVMTERAR